MISKKKAYKIIISAIALFAFARWGLDPKLICDVVSTTPDICGYPDGSTGYTFNSVFKVILIAVAIPLLVLWVEKK